MLIKQKLNPDDISGTDENSIDDSPDLMTQMDLMTFEESTMELLPMDDTAENGSIVLLNELQASVTEAASVIENEIKGTLVDLINII